MKIDISVFLEKLFYNVERGMVLVFPTMEDKREFLYSYVENTGKAISGSSALSYDEFRALFLPYREKREVSLFEKVRFVENLIDSDPNELTSFYNPKFSESKREFALDIAGKLKDLKAVIEDDAVCVSLSEGLQKDISFLYQNYIDFINAHNLIEPHFESLDATLLDANRNEFLLILPELNSYYINDAKILKNYNNIKIETFENVSVPPIMKYDNIDEEIRGTLRYIHSLLKNGESPKDIKIVFLGSDEKAKSTFMRLSYLYDVPLKYNRTYSKESNNLHLFFMSIRNIYNNGSHISDVESLFTNSMLNFKESTSAMYFYFVNNVLEKVDTNLIVDSDYRKFYEDLLFSIGAIVDANNSSEFITALTKFSSQFLYDNTDIFVAAKELSTEIDSYCDDNSESCSFFDKFMLLLENTASTKNSDAFSSESVLKNDSDAIECEDYGCATFTPTKYRFMLFSTSDNAKKEIKQYRIISDFEKEKAGILDDKKDIAADLFSLYSGFSKELIVSYSEQNFTGFALAPAFFDEIKDALKDETYISLRKQDPEYSENNLYQSSMNFNKNDISDNSKILYNNTLKHINDSTSVEYYKENYAISPTTLKDIENCPFSWCLNSFIDNRLNPIDEKRALNVRAYNKEGEFYHTVIEEFYKRKQIDDFEEGLNFKDALSLVYDEVLATTKCSSFFPPRVMEFLKTDCKEKFLNILENDTLLGLEYIDSEVKLETEIDSVRVKGRLDGLFATYEGDIVIVDYKRSKSSIPTKSSFNVKHFENDDEQKLPYYQAPFYMMLYSKINETNVKGFIYYSFMDNGYLSFPLLPYKGNEYLGNDELITITKDAIKRADGYIKNGVFEANGKNCKKCDFKSMCRVRFM